MHHPLFAGGVAILVLLNLLIEAVKHGALSLVRDQSYREYSTDGGEKEAPPRTLKGLHEKAAGWIRMKSTALHTR